MADGYGNGVLGPVLTGWSLLMQKHAAAMIRLRQRLEAYEAPLTETQFSPGEGLSDHVWDIVFAQLQGEMSQ